MTVTTGAILRRIAEADLSAACHKLATIILDGIAWKEGYNGREHGTGHYRSSRPDDARLRTRLRELSGERRRFGCRRLHILLKREGWRSIGRSSTASTGKSG